ncbi:hypothetical protein SP15_105 [Bacillus phage SP-15]|uniref:Uncharacterized protein n=1 Tax=Bacillus phage SP-15 TaxID=1792032 RepID=A0A127AXC3_9CAUD|nr:hypothetical protein SP15_105 [Bacillus phage SP-15]AMM44904.1 hypothetical protein SP15_105 [Bacillus phage SP-15]
MPEINLQQYDVLGQVNKVIEVIKTLSGFEDYELQIVRDVNIAVSKAYPTGRTACQERLSALDTLRGRLNTLILLLKDHRSKEKRFHQSKHDKEYVRLTRLGRPNSQAINSEIRSSFPDLAENESKLERLKQIIDYLDQLLWDMDKVRGDLLDRAGDSARRD